MRRPAISQSDNRPPIGGWGVTYEEKGQAWSVTGTNPYRIVDQIASIQQINNSFTTIDAVWDFCNNIWRARDPKRAISENTNQHEPKLPKSMRKDHWKIEPSRYGSMLWRNLHLFGTVFDKQDWEAAIKRTVKFLDPEQSPYTGCPECLNEFAQILKTDPPDYVNSEEEAADWSWRVHNRVNKRIGNSQISFREAAKFYGWKVEI